MRWTQPSSQAEVEPGVGEKKIAPIFSLRNVNIDVKSSSPVVSNIDSFFVFAQCSRRVPSLVAFQYLIKYDKINRRTMAYRGIFCCSTNVWGALWCARIYVAIRFLSLFAYVDAHTSTTLNFICCNHAMPHTHSHIQAARHRNGEKT